jgi:hypothetical protein
MPKLWRIVRKTLLISGIVLGSLILLVSLLTYIFEDDIKAMAVKEVNKNLKARIIISGENINLTFISSFPNAAIEFENFKMLEPGNKTVLAKVGLLNFEFSPFDFLKGKYHIRGILLKDAIIHLKVNEYGAPNYLVLKYDTVVAVKKEATPLDIDLKHIRLKNVRLTYDDLQVNQHYNALINNATFAGSFTDAQYSLATNADLLAESIVIDNQNYLSHKAISLKAALDIDNRTKKYAIRSFRLKLDKSVFSANGSLTNKDEGLLYDLKLKGEDANIQTILALLPNSVSSTFKDYKSKGDISFSGGIQGLWNKNEMPGLEFKFSIANGTIQDGKHALGLNSVNLDGRYSNGSSHTLKTSLLHIDHVTASLNGRNLTARFALDNFDDPLADVYLKSNLNLNDLKNFASIPGIDSMAGDLAVDASFKGRIADLKQYSTIKKTKLSGTVVLKNVGLKPSVQQFSYKNLNGDFNTNGNDMLIRSFSGTFGHTDFKMTGEFRNLASFLFLPNQTLQAVSTLECQLINVDDFIFSTGKKGSEKSSPQQFDFPPFMAFNFTLKADKLVFGKFEAENITGQVRMQEKSATFHDVNMKTMGGQVKMDGSIQDVDSRHFKATAHAVIKGIDVKKGFYELDNFGQTYFTDKYIKGRLDATIDYTGYWNKDLSADMNSIVAIADITIYNGEIHKFPQLMALGKYMKVKSLDDIAFSEYSNRLYIRNSKVEIPKMEIKSSAVNMTLAGTHSFDNIMDYKMKLNMSQLLFGNRQNYESEFGEVQVDNKGGVNVFLTMTGPAGGDYKIRYDAKSSVKNMGTGLADEKKEIEKIFKTNSPNAKPGENLNKPTEQEFHFNPEKPFDKMDTDNNNDDGNDGIPPKRKARAEDTARKKAFDTFKKKLNKSH